MCARPLFAQISTTCFYERPVCAVRALGAGTRQGLSALQTLFIPEAGLEEGGDLSLLILTGPPPRHPLLSQNGLEGGDLAEKSVAVLQTRRTGNPALGNPRLSIQIVGHPLPRERHRQPRVSADLKPRSGGEPTPSYPPEDAEEEWEDPYYYGDWEDYSFYGNYWDWPYYTQGGYSPNLTGGGKGHKGSGQYHWVPKGKGKGAQGGNSAKKKKNKGLNRPIWWSIVNGKAAGKGKKGSGEPAENPGASAEAVLADRGRRWADASEEAKAAVRAGRPRLPTPAVDPTWTKVEDGQDLKWNVSEKVLAKVWYGGEEGLSHLRVPRTPKEGGLEPRRFSSPGIGYLLELKKVTHEDQSPWLNNCLDQQRPGELGGTGELQRAADVLGYGPGGNDVFPPPLPPVRGPAKSPSREPKREKVKKKKEGKMSGKAKVKKMLDRARWSAVGTPLDPDYRKPIKLKLRKRKKSSSSNTSAEASSSDSSSEAGIGEEHRLRSLAKKLPGYLARSAAKEAKKVLAETIGEDPASFKVELIPREMLGLTGDSEARFAYREFSE
eukprot:s4959_g3.t1